METLARIPSEYDNSSEFRYRSPILDSRTLVVSVCQSGETVDTLAAMELARDLGSSAGHALQLPWHTDHSNRRTHTDASCRP